jgi:hypothetical protein
MEPRAAPGADKAALPLPRSSRRWTGVARAHKVTFSPSAFQPPGTQSPDGTIIRCVMSLPALATGCTGRPPLLPLARALCSRARVQLRHVARCSTWRRRCPRSAGRRCRRFRCCASHGRHRSRGLRQRQQGCGALVGALQRAAPGRHAQLLPIRASGVPVERTEPGKRHARDCAARPTAQGRAGAAHTCSTASSGRRRPAGRQCSMCQELWRVANTSADTGGPQAHLLGELGGLEGVHHLRLIAVEGGVAGACAARLPGAGRTGSHCILYGARGPRRAAGGGAPGAWRGGHGPWGPPS